MKKVLVVDGNSILNRAFYGIRPLTTRDGKYTNAIFGMLRILLRHMDDIKPDYAAVAFDLKAPNFRKKVYDAYKAGRHPTPPELLSQFDDAKECLSLLGLHVLTLEGYEADDILGSVACLAEAEEDTHTYVLSGDRDLLQLISPRVTVLLATTGDTLPFDRNAFFEKYGIEPTEFVDMKAIMGDSSDNIPGVPGIGEKGAQRLIAAHHTLDRIYEEIDAADITKSLREKLISGKESAYLSQFLARIERNAPLPCTLSELAYIGIPDRRALSEKLTSLELAALRRRLRLEEDAAPAASDADEAEADTAPRSTASPLCECTEVDAEKLLSLDAPLGVYVHEDKLYLADAAVSYAYSGSLLPLTPLFTGEKTLITFDGKALYHRLKKEGITLGGTPLDIMLYHYVLNPQANLKTPDILAADLGEEATPDRVASQCLRSEPTLRARVAEAGAMSLLFDIELPLAMLLAKIEETGFRLDKNALLAFGERLKIMIADTEARIYDMAGEAFNINSPKQLGEILFVKLGLPAKKKTKSGYSTDADVLSLLRPYHPIIGEILEYRQTAKLYSTYVVGLSNALSADGRLRTDFKQALTATGRLSSAEPNLQNIPIRTALGREMRGFFIPADGCVLVDADYSQIELRLLAAVADDDTMCDAFRNGEDIHRETASAVFGIPESEVTDELRKRAKAINFGIVYGIGGFSLSEDLGISVAEATAYIKAYLATYPKVDMYLREVVENAAKAGYTETLFHRRRYIPELKASNRNMQAFGRRIAMNSPIQGSAADIIKVAMLRVDRRLTEEQLPARIVMQVHDELIVEAEKEAAPRVAALLKEEMEAAVQLRVPLTAEVSVGDSWLCKA